MMVPQRILLTGGAGFIGSHIADAFLAAGHELLVLDDLSSGRRENVPSGVTLSVLEVRSDAAAAALRAFNPNVLCHQAAQMDVRRSVADPRFDAEVNLLGLLNLMEAARELDIEQVIFASTGGAIYGEQDEHPATENHPTRPISPYGVAKLASERYLYFYYSEYGINATCLRYANVYGPRQNPHGEAGVVAIFIRKILDADEPVINGDGEQTRDYVFVGDVVSAAVAVLGLDGFRIYNVGTGVETSVNQLYAAIRGLLGGPAALTGPAKAGEQRRSSITSAKLRSERSVPKARSLNEGLIETLAWFKAQHRKG